MRGNATSGLFDDLLVEAIIGMDATPQTECRARSTTSRLTHLAGPFGVGEQKRHRVGQSAAVVLLHHQSRLLVHYYLWKSSNSRRHHRARQRRGLQGHQWKPLASRRHQNYRSPVQDRRHLLRLNPTDKFHHPERDQVQSPDAPAHAAPAHLQP